MENNTKFDGVSQAIESLLTKYLDMHQGSSIPRGLYSCVIKEVEQTLLNTILKFTNGNQAEASRILGINRNTLRKKLVLLKLLKSDRC